ncbi:MAG: Fic family protein [Thermoplasmata archaeon]
MRAGKYVEDKDGVLSFWPIDLPPNPPLEIDSEMADLLSRAERSLGRLDGISGKLPNPNLFIAMYVRQEATLSSQIEGTQASLMDVLEYEAAEINDDRVPDVIEIVNYVSALDYGLSQCKTRDISIELLNEIHLKLLADARGSEKNPGHLRETQNWIGPEGCTIFDAAFVPPPPAEIERLLNELMAFIKVDAPYPALLRYAMIHSQFETIHPYLDGNGRMGRLLITLLLCKESVISRPILYLSLFFKKNRSQYYRLLQKVRDDGDWELFVKFFLSGIYDISEDAIKTASKIQDLKDKHHKMIADTFRSITVPTKLLDSLYEIPFIKVNKVVELLEISYPAANNLVEKFETLGILVEITGQKRNRIYNIKDYIDIFPQ